MTPKEIELLAKACRMAGIDATKITPANPYEKSGGTAGMLQAAVAELNPVQAAKWRVAAGGGLSLATMAELQSGQPLSESAQNDLYAHDPQFVRDVQQQQERAAEDQLKQLEEKTAELRMNRAMREAGGNKWDAERRLAAEDQANELHARRLAGERV